MSTDPTTAALSKAFSSIGLRRLHLRPLVELHLHHPRRLPARQLPRPWLPGLVAHGHVVPDLLRAGDEGVLELLDQALLEGGSEDGAGHAILSPGGCVAVDDALHTDLVDCVASIVEEYLEGLHHLCHGRISRLPRVEVRGHAEDPLHLLLVLVLHEDVVSPVADVPPMLVRIGLLPFEVEVVTAHETPACREAPGGALATCTQQLRDRRTRDERRRCTNARLLQEQNRAHPTPCACLPAREASPRYGCKKCRGSDRCCCNRGAGTTRLRGHGRAWRCAARNQLCPELRRGCCACARKCQGHKCRPQAEERHH
mmetsp:Transcript_22315/g.47529  ORF Transcript_22315/g.47529 Transcript_22315/m.47529 type:complete len:313 (-) Transcript_22315:119-1057(-)